jgi:L-aspartate oxidase
VKTITTDILIIGTGIAGLAAALEAGKSGTAQVLLISKTDIHKSNTSLAQGGIAAALADDDSPAYHLQDTLLTGAGLSSPAAVQVLVEEGTRQVQNLIKLGAQFEHEDGKIVFGQEGAHTKRRILFAGDTTGAVIERSLGQAVQQLKNVQVLERQRLVQLLVSEGECFGAVVFDRNTRELITYHASAVILSTGGYGQAFLFNTNPDTTTGDGIHVAHKAGAVICDMEFVQFHPTTLFLGDKKPVSLFLISEAVRGEGAVLRNIYRERFMPKYDERAELAPRDIVSRAIWSEMAATQSQHVLLDFTAIKDVDLAKRFPSIHYRCMQAGIDLRSELVPVAPATHYCMGGIKTGLWGETNIANLFAAGECASSGVHGANRLASNSLLEGLVFGTRAAKKAMQKKSLSKAPAFTVDEHYFQNLFKRAATLSERTQIQEVVWHSAGIVRNAQGLQAGLDQLKQIQKNTNLDWNSQTLLQVGLWIIQAALQREESRGAHFRSDFPQTDDVRWKRSICF